jgi:hypothetical protein
MSHVKVIPPGAQIFEIPSIAMIKLAKQGFYGQDLKDFIKRAGHPFADIARNMKVASGEIPIHLIALGSTEAYGLNRNADGFSNNACRKYHDTFVKHARWYRNHQNKDKAKSYGIVKYSMFNEPMKRIELIVFLNGTKEAAERNGGLIADKEIEALESGKDIADSMACKLAYDVCTYCGNKAANRSEYCDDDSKSKRFCKAGGLKRNIGKILENGLALGADNPHPDFFDISNVLRNADRIAWVLGKCASADKTLSGAQLAEELGVTAPLEVLLAGMEPSIASQIKCAFLLAEKEANLSSSHLDRAFDPAVQSLIFGLEPLPDKRDIPKVLNALAREKIALSVKDFLRLTNASHENLAAEVTQRLPGIFTKLANSELLESLLQQNPYGSYRNNSSKMNNWATKFASEHSLSRNYLNSRIMRSAIYSEEPPQQIKEASILLPNNVASNLATQYALYKIALFHDIASIDSDIDLTADLLVRQNYFPNT